MDYDIKKTIMVDDVSGISVGCLYKYNNNKVSRTYGLCAIVHNGVMSNRVYHHAKECCFCNVEFSRNTNLFYACGYNKVSDDIYDGVILVFDKSLNVIDRKVFSAGPMTCFNKIKINVSADTENKLFDSIDVEGSVCFNNDYEDVGINNHLFVKFDNRLNIMSRRITPV